MVLVGSNDADKVSPVRVCGVGLLPLFIFNARRFLTRKAEKREHKAILHLHTNSCMLRVMSKDKIQLSNGSTRRWLVQKSLDSKYNIVPHWIGRLG